VPRWDKTEPRIDAAVARALEDPTQQKVLAFIFDVEVRIRAGNITRVLAIDWILAAQSDPSSMRAVDALLVEARWLLAPHLLTRPPAK
jgi:hypothetical protein